MKRLLMSLFLLLAILPLAVHTGQSSVLQPLAAPIPLSPTPPPPDGLEDKITGIEQAIRVALETDKNFLLGALLFDVEIQGIRLSADQQWATAWLGFSDPQTGKILPSEPGLALITWTGSEWQVWLPADPDWAEALAAAPTELISTEAKAGLLRDRRVALSRAAAGPFRGYRLPWEGGQTAYVSQTVLHDAYTPSGNAHYAFDFYVPEQKFALHAAKSGTVWRFKNDVVDRPDDDPNPIPGSDGNYLVLQDTTTSPVSYQLYLHLSQNTIPPELRVKGVFVRQGQFIGRADNTGQSWGNHLHFQVHTNPDSFWGASVDIIFDDVSINGGRPRVSADKPYCLSSDVCTQFQDAYVSGNIINSDLVPPQGSLRAPQPGITLNSARMKLEGWASDIGSGLQSARFIALYKGAWHDLGTPFTTGSFSMDWDLCAAGVPDGPVSLGLHVLDQAGNTSPGIPGLRHIVKNYECPVSPPPCSPTENQVALFADPDYRGACVTLPTGTYINGAALGVLGGDNAASLKVGANASATLYTRDNQAGRSETFTANDSSLADNKVENDTLSSIVVAQRSNLITGSPESPPALPGAAAAATVTAPWSDAMESGFNGWSIDNDSSLWDQEQVNNENTAGKISWRYGQDGEATYDTGSANSGSLTSPGISIPSDGKTYYLRFWYSYETETAGLHWDQRWVQLSVGGGAFNNILQLSEDPMNVWLQSPAINLSKYAGQTIQVRYFFNTVDSIDNGYKGWYIDDFSINTQAPPACADTNNSPAEAQTIQPGSPIQAEICPGGDIDYYKFEAKAADQIGAAIDALSVNPDSTLDSALFLLDGDGKSVLAENDDQIDQVRTDSWLQYRLTRSGVYYLKVRAWNHPSGGDSQHTYTLRFYKENFDPAVDFLIPLDGSRLPGEPVTLTVSANDGGSGIGHVEFFWHSGDWLASDWIELSEDWTPQDGWTAIFDPTQIPEQSGIAFYAQIYDWAGNWIGTGAWFVSNTSGVVYLPLTVKK